MEKFLSEDTLHLVVGLLVRLVEAAGVLIIFAGCVIGFIRFAVAFWSPHAPRRFSMVRLTLGRFLSLGLEFQLASDLLRTAVSPSFEQIGKLAAVATIRTLLNFFLARELKEVSEETPVPGTSLGPTN